MTKPACTTRHCTNGMQQNPKWLLGLVGTLSMVDVKKSTCSSYNSSR